MNSISPVIVIGIGNVIMGDDGVGPRVIELLERKDDLNADLLTLDTPGFSLLTHIQDREKVIIVDAARFDDEPGSIRRITRDSIASKEHSGLSLHDADPFAVVDYAEKLGLAPRELIVYAIRFQSIEPRMSLSPVIEQAATETAQLIADEL